MLLYSSLRIIIFTNGTLDPGFVVGLKKTDYVIGVDRAAWWLIERGVMPHLAIGDFDSTNPDELAIIKRGCKSFLAYPANKDFTDTDLALQKAVALNSKEIILFGATGTRIDHTLANIYLLELPLSHQISCCIRDRNNEIRLIDGSLRLEKNEDCKYVSILPASDLVEFSLDGFVYSANHCKLHRGESLGISNEISNKFAKIVIHSGQALVIQSKD